MVSQIFKNLKPKNSVDFIYIHNRNNKIAKSVNITRPLLAFPNDPKTQWFQRRWDAQDRGFDSHTDTNIC